jgi:hypothetical protein
MTRVGWLFALLGIGWFAWDLRFLLDLGGPVQLSWAAVLQGILAAARGAAVVAMPAALEIGVPGARMRTRWLYRGLVLLSLEQLARPLLSLLQQLAFDSLGPEALQPSLDQPISLALVLAALAVNLLALAGTWSLSDGLADAGARARRWLIAVVVAVAMALTLVAYLPGFGFFAEGSVFDLSSLALWANLLGLAVGLVEIALWVVVAVRLLAGVLGRRLRPREAWLYGGLAGLLILAVRIGYPLVMLSGITNDGLTLALNAIAAGPWIFLFIAFTAGLGRGRERRAEPPRRLRLFVLNPTT